MTEKIKNEIKIKARQITDDIISFMQELDTVTNKENKELKIDAEYYQNRITDLENVNAELEAKLTNAKEIIRKYYKYNPSCEYSYEDIDNEAKQFLGSKNESR